MDPISPSFCAAKWFEGTVWLNSGLTASCHHTPTHEIDTEEILKNPAAVFNTNHKKQMRQMMLEGGRPEECSYCWKVEDAGQTGDRVFKSMTFPRAAVKELAQIPASADIIPQTLEIAFDRICQFACMYCSPSYSTTWVQDIQKNGPYRNLITDREHHYDNLHESVKKTDGDHNPYVDAFWAWWPELSQKLKTLRVTGGEPLLSPHFWRLLEFLETAPPTLNLAVNSNLGVKNETVVKFAAAIRSRPSIEIYTSGEAFGVEAEYVRDGKNWGLWCQNIETLLAEPAVKKLCVSFTLNSLSLFSMTRMLDQVLQWKNQFGEKRVVFFLNILRFPRFQSPLVLPVGLKNKVAKDLRTWLAANEIRIQNFEKESVLRFLAYLENVTAPTSAMENPMELASDLKRFLVQYDTRRKKNYRSVFNSELVTWLDGLEGAAF